MIPVAAFRWSTFSKILTRTGYDTLGRKAHVFPTSINLAVRHGVLINGRQSPSSDPRRHFRTAGIARLEKPPIVSFEEIHQLAISKDDANPKPVIVDVREPNELLEGKIPKAENIPLSSFHNALKMDDKAFENAYHFSKPPKDREIILYCKSGRRSTEATEIAKSEGYTEVRNYPGSWLEYSEKTNVKA